MPVAQSQAHYINSSKGCPSITESFPLVGFLVLCAIVAALPVVQPHSQLNEEENLCARCTSQNENIDIHSTKARFDYVFRN
jgi:hypothetical protein